MHVKAAKRCGFRTTNMCRWVGSNVANQEEFCPGRGYHLQPLRRSEVEGDLRGHRWGTDFHRLDFCMIMLVSPVAATL